jgi:hypothetical protein
MPAPATASRSTLVMSVLFAVAILAVYGAMNSYQLSARYAQRYPDAYGAGSAQVRFAPLVDKVPPATVLGYFTDVAPSDAFNAAFLAAQHAVAPRLLVLLNAQDKQAGPEWAVGNFSKPQDFAALGKAYGYNMQADLGNGIVLFRKAGA